MSTLLNVADVLEKAASLLDEQLSEKTAAMQREREAAVNAVSRKYAASRGEPLPADLRRHLLNADPAAFDAALKLAATDMDESPDSMGSGSETPDSSYTPRTKKEASEQAHDAFTNFLMDNSH